MLNLMLILDLIVLSEFYGVQKFVNNTTKKRASGAKWPVVGILIEFDIAILIYVRLLKILSGRRFSYAGLMLIKILVKQD